MVGGLGLDDETLVARNTGEDGRLLDGPLADVGEGLLFGVDGRLLDGVGGRPTRFPAGTEGKEGRRGEEGGSVFMKDV
jgi:hypothetical protein